MESASSLEDSEMTQMLRETENLSRRSSSADAPSRGIAFVPCLLCRAPVDLAAVVADDRAPLCDGHRAADHAPLR
jgi:hypothetical protein